MLPLAEGGAGEAQEGPGWQGLRGFLNSTSMFTKWRDGFEVAGELGAAPWPTQQGPETPPTDGGGKAVEKPLVFPAFDVMGVAEAPVRARSASEDNSVVKQNAPRPRLLRQASDPITKQEQEAAVSGENPPTTGPDLWRRFRTSSGLNSVRLRRESRGLSFMPPLSTLYAMAAEGMSTLFAPTFSSSSSSKISSSAEEASPRTFLCEICGENHSPRSAYKVRACEEPNHSSFCLACTETNLRVAIDEGIVDIHCMCGCGVFFAPDEITALLSPSSSHAALLAKYQRFATMRSNTNFRECPYCTVPYSDASLERPKIVCPNAVCAKEYCFIHGGQHPNLDCQSFSKLLLERDKASLAAIDRTTKPCPKCHSATEKNSGCNHMTCRLCSCDWCWICGGDITGGVTEHYDMGGPSACGGLQFANAATAELLTPLLGTARSLLCLHACSYICLGLTYFIIFLLIVSWVGYMLPLGLFAAVVGCCLAGPAAVLYHSLYHCGRASLESICSRAVDGAFQAAFLVWYGLAVGLAGLAGAPVFFALGLTGQLYCLVSLPFRLHRREVLVEFGRRDEEAPDVDQPAPRMQTQWQLDIPQWMEGDDEALPCWLWRLGARPPLCVALAYYLLWTLCLPFAFSLVPGLSAGPILFQCLQDDE